MKIFFVTFLTIQLVILTQALKFSELTGLDINMKVVSFSKYEDKCVFVSEMDPEQKVSENNRYKFMNSMLKKYKNEGLEVIGYIKDESSKEILDNYDFDVYLGSSIKNLNEFLGRTKLSTKDNFLVKKDGENYEHLKFNFIFDGPDTRFESFSDFLLHRAPDNRGLIETHIQKCLGIYKTWKQRYQGWNKNFFSLN